CQKGYIEDFLHTSGTGSLIEDHVCFGDTGKPKDFSIRLCMERNELQRALYVGDTAGDLDAARKAGIPFIYAAYGFGQVDAEKEKVPSIEAFSQLPGAVTALWEKAGNRR
ncbi:MAG TPA: HAD family hydrolase, partial [Lachnospiraceae bacterium]|nr:HAD family hydrolase [Lachnospiraceae bacterium]